MPDPTHGTEAGYRKHKAEGSEPCPPCRDAARAAWRAKERRRKGSTGHLPGACAWCGGLVSRPFRPGRPDHYCSPACRTEAKLEIGRRANDRRRSRMVAGFVSEVDRLAVFERDGWICQLCFDPVDPGLRRPDPMAAQLDHIVPLAKGGTHESSNCQLAHARCNFRKGSRSDAEQLHLSG